MFALRALLVSAFLASASGAAHAVDYVSVEEASAVLYDAPSQKAKKLFVVSRYMPLEVIVSVEGWLKVRDSGGGLAWVEKKSVGNKRFVVVSVPQAVVRQQPDEKAPTVFQAKQQVALEWLEDADGGWLKVRHADGEAGYVRFNEVWGH